MPTLSLRSLLFTDDDFEPLVIRRIVKRARRNVYIWFSSGWQSVHSINLGQAGNLRSMTRSASCLLTSSTRRSTSFSGSGCSVSAPSLALLSFTGEARLLTKLILMLNATQNRNIAQTEKRHLLIIKIIHKLWSQRQYISGAYLQTQINNLKVNGFGGLVCVWEGESVMEALC